MKSSDQEENGSKDRGSSGRTGREDQVRSIVLGVQGVIQSGNEGGGDSDGVQRVAAS